MSRAASVPKGYKQTDVGVIPSDWTMHTIQDLIDQNVIVGHLDGNHGALYPRSHEFKDSGVPYITANDLRGYTVSFTTCKYLSEERARRFVKGIAKNGDVLFAHNATVGPTALLSTQLNYVILSTTATYFRCNSEKLKNSFLLYVLKSAFFVKQYQAVMAQSTRNQVPITAQRKLSVILPPTKAEQEAIAEALSDADALIESLEQLIDKKRHLKQGAMQELLTGKRRLPGFETKPGYKQTEVGVIPEDWDAPTIGTLGDFSKGRGVSKDEASSGDLPCVRYGEIYTHHSDIICSFNSKISVEVAKSSVRIKKGDILFAGSGETKEEIGKCVAFIGDEEAYAGGDIVILRPNKGDSTFFGYLFNAPIVARQKASKGQGDAVVHISGTALASIKIPLPPTNAEQNAIATILCDMDAEIAALETKLAKAHLIKQGMMQELLTGRIRLI